MAENVSVSYGHVIRLTESLLGENHHPRKGHFAMPTNTLTSSPASFLSPLEQHIAIIQAQDVPIFVTTDDDGEERVTYGKTPESEAALERLVTAFTPALKRAARATKTLDADDAYSTALVEFLAAVRRYDLTSDVPFSATISVVLFRAVALADRTSDLITVKENVAARYWRLLHKHGHDVNAAYDECVETSNGFDPATFLAVHRALSSMDSLDASLDDDFAPLMIASSDPSPENSVVDADTVDWLFGKVTDRQEGILRARYGFSDPATEKVLVDSGLRPGEVLSDVQVAEVLHIGRATVQRDHKAGLVSMRSAYQELLDESDDL